MITRVPGDGFERLVLVFRSPQVVLREIGDVQFTGIGLDLDDSEQVVTLIDNRQQTVAQHGDPFRVAPAHQRNLAQHIALQCQLDQKRFIAHHRIQGFALRIVGQVRRFIFFHARQRFGIDHHLIVRQPDTLLALRGTFKTLLQP
ncbi:hypothetical protein D3C86_1659050 [compost metagenome]